jgi:hypothetical protein
MKNWLKSAGAFALPFVVLAAGGVPAHAASVMAPVPINGRAECDRACLKGFVDQYLAALLAHDPSRLPVTRGIKFTENTVRLNLGEALWTTASALGPYRVDIADPETGQAGYVGVVIENGRPVMLALRLKIEKGLIAEAETIVARAGLMSPTIPKELANKVEKPIWAALLKPAERVSRDQMIAAANQYFEGMEHDTGSIVPFDDSCNRTENGTQTTNNPGLLANMPPPPPGAAASLPPRGPNPLMMGCKAQMNAGGMWIFTTPDRRFWMVDEERGIVIGLFMFTVTGLGKDGRIGTPPPTMMGTPAEPSSKPIAEMFKIKNGRIYEIEAIMAPQAGYRMLDGW